MNAMQRTEYDELTWNEDRYGTRRKAPSREKLADRQRDRARQNAKARKEFNRNSG